MSIFFHNQTEITSVMKSFSTENLLISVSFILLYILHLTFQYVVYVVYMLTPDKGYMVYGCWTRVPLVIFLSFLFSLCGTRLINVNHWKRLTDYGRGKMRADRK